MKRAKVGFNLHVVALRTAWGLIGPTLWSQLKYLIDWWMDGCELLLRNSWSSADGSQKKAGGRFLDSARERRHEEPSAELWTRNQDRRLRRGSLPPESHSEGDVSAYSGNWRKNNIDLPPHVYLEFKKLKTIQLLLFFYHTKGITLIKRSRLRDSLYL